MKSKELLNKIDKLTKNGNNNKPPKTKKGAITLGKEVKIDKCSNCSQKAWCTTEKKLCPACDK